MNQSTRFKGTMITLEGIEGAGKSSVISELAQQILDLGYTVLVTREPGGPPIAESIRSLLLNSQDGEIDAITETLLIWAARRQHWLDTIQPALTEGTWVLCDRFVDSSVAYQQYGRGISPDLIATLHRETLSAYQPNLTLLFMVDPDRGFSRIRDQGKPLDRIEREHKAFFRKVSEGYAALAESQHRRIVQIDADTTQAKVLIQAQKAVSEFCTLVYEHGDYQ